MSNAQGQNFQHEIKQYRSIFISLIILTAISVGIHQMHLNLALSITLILSIAVLQATLSVCYLMHLISERKLIFLVLMLTVFFVFGMVTLILGSHASHPHGTTYVS